MPYIVNFTDSDNKEPITVYDNTSSTDTSLTFPGRNVTGYGQIIAENFLGLLENFASATQPVNPIEGQLWYDSENGVLMIWDNTNWKAASNIQKGPTEPSVENSKIGELWVDTTNQQLRIYSGTRWILVGPSESSLDGLRYGPAVEQIDDSNGAQRNILILYIADIPVSIISKDTFTPKIAIAGFNTISAGVNIANPETAEQRALFEGGFLPKLIGTASNADALNIGDQEIPASRFLRTDTINTTDFGMNIRNNAGMKIGIDGNFNITTSSTASKIYNSTSGSSIDLQVNRNNIATTIVRIINNTVGINVAAPEKELDLDGDFGLTGTIVTTNSEDTTNFANGSFRTGGGAAIGKTLRVGGQTYLSETLNADDIIPSDNETKTLGSNSKRWQNVYAKTITADEIVGTINGSITGNANTATNLKTTTTFRLAGDVVSDNVVFDGQVGGNTKTFNTQLQADIIKSRPSPVPNRSTEDDFLLVYRAELDPAVNPSSATPQGLVKIARDQFVLDLGVPIGALLPYSGPNAPEGYLFCDGSEIEIAKYPDLYDVIGSRYNGSAALSGVNTYRIPDLRGRFALGKHNMNNNLNVPTPAGALVGAGGGEPDPARVEGTAASTLASSAGQSTVTLTQANLPDHVHNMQDDRGNQYGAVKQTAQGGVSTDSSINVAGAPSGRRLLNSGGIATSGNLSDPFGVMNPFLTVNYIIRTGIPKFTTE